MSRYTKLTAKGLYKDNTTGNYYCKKSIDKIPYSRTFISIYEAKDWLKHFHPDKESFSLNVKTFKHLNGSKNIMFADAWNEYKSQVYPGLEISTRDSRERRMDRFVKGLMDLNMRYLNPTVIDDLIDELKDRYLKKPNGRRKNFNYEINTFTCFFAWYVNNKDFFFKSPIIARRHKPRGIIVRTISSEKPKMRIEHVSRFLSSLKELNEDNGIYYDFALLQFLTASRAQDIAGLSKHQIDFEFKEILFSQALAWVRNKEIPDYIKSQKNGFSRVCHLTNDMNVLILKYFNNALKAKKKTDQVLFHKDGTFLKFDHLRRAYEGALSHAKLDHIYSGTHILRRAMAKVTREEFNSLDHVQAITGHRDIKQAEHYAGRNTSLQKVVVGRIEERLKLVE